jgi:hypothetical protein
VELAHIDFGFIHEMCIEDLPELQPRAILPTDPAPGRGAGCYHVEKRVLKWISPIAQ